MIFSSKDADTAVMTVVFSFIRINDRQFFQQGPHPVIRDMPDDHAVIAIWAATVRTVKVHYTSARILLNVKMQLAQKDKWYSK